MRDLNFYIKNAMEKQGLTSKRKLCEAIGVTHSATDAYNRGSFPADETMIKIAKLAEIDAETALLDLSMWKTSGAAQKTYASILQKITQVSACLALMIGFTLTPTPSYASETLSNDKSVTVYYGKEWLVVYLLLGLPSTNG